MTLNSCSKNYWTDVTAGLCQEATPKSPKQPINGRWGFYAQPISEKFHEKILNFFNWQRQAAQNDLKKIDEYKNEWFILSVFHKNHPRDNEIAQISEPLETVLTKVRLIDEKRLSKAENTFKIKVLCLVGCAGIFLPKVSAISFLFASVVWGYNWFIYGKDEDEIKKLYREIGKEANQIRYALSYYDSNMKLKNQQDVGFVNSEDTGDLQPPTQEVIDKIEYPEPQQIQQENPSSTRSESCNLL